MSAALGAFLPKHRLVDLLVQKRVSLRIWSMASLSPMPPYTRLWISRQALRSAQSRVCSLGGGRRSAMSLPQNHRYQSSRSAWVTLSRGMLGNESFAISRLVRKIKCMCSNCLRVVGSFLVSSSSSFSQPSTVIFRLDLMGLSSCSGRAEMMYLLAIQPISPWEQCLN